MTTATTFRPVPRSSVAAKIFAFVVACSILAGTFVMLMLLTSSGRVSYVIGGGALTVDSGSRLDGVRTVPLGNAKGSVVTLSGGRRLKGTRMSGVCSGKWWFEEITYVWLAGNCGSRGVLVTGGEEPIAITPPDPEGFLRMLDARSDARVELPPSDDAWILRLIPGLGLVLLLVAGTSAILTFLVAPSRLVYRASGGKLEIDTLFSKNAWPASSLRARRHEPASVRRVMGTAFPGYYTGRFRADGLATRMFASDLKSGVLVEGPDVRLYLSPEEPDAFLAALKREGASLG